MIIEFNTRDILVAFFRQKQKFTLVFATILLLGLIYIVIADPTYKATGSMLVRFGKEATPNLSAEQRWANGDPSKDVRTEIVESNIKILQSRSLLESALNDIGVGNAYPSIQKISDKKLQMEYAIRNASTDLDIRSGNKDAIIQVSFFHKDPDISAKFVNTLMDRFIIRQAEVYNKPETEFLNEQVKAAKSKLDSSKQKFSNFKNEKGISNIENELEELLRQKGDAAKSSFDAVIEAQKNLSELEAQLAKMSATYRSSSPAITRLNRSIEEAKQQLNERQRELDTSHASESGMSMQLETINRRIAYLESLAGEYNELSQDVEVDTSNYKNYLQHNEENRITQSLNKENITRITVVDKPTAPARPERPRKKVILFVTILTALLAAAGTALAFEVMDERFSNPKQLPRSLRLPLLEKFRDDITESELVSLYGAIENAIKSNACPVLHFTSAYKNEGSSIISYNLAALIANQTNKRVLFIDTLAETSIYKFSEQIQPLTTRPSSYAEISPRLFYGTFQQPKSPPVIFANSEEAKVLMQNLRSQFDIILINTNGLFTNSAILTVASSVDGHILVVEADKTRAPVAEEALSLIKSNGGIPLGTVLNKRKLYIPEWLYKRIYA